MQATLFSTLLALLALAATITAAPISILFTKRQIGGQGVGPVCKSTTAPTSADIQSSLDTWLGDVQVVNKFLNNVPATALAAKGLKRRAQVALTSANDEPVQLGIMSCVPGLDASAQKAVASAAAGFGDNVLKPLGNIVDRPANLAGVVRDARTINDFRCCSLLPGLDALWASAAAQEGLAGQVKVSPPRPDACRDRRC